MSQEILSLRRNSEEFDSVLLNGTIRRHGELWAAIPREIVRNHIGHSKRGKRSQLDERNDFGVPRESDPDNPLDSIIFETTRLTDRIRPSLLRVWFHSIRPETLPLILLPSLTMAAYGLMRDWTASWGRGLAAFLGVVFFQIAANALSDVNDHLRFVTLSGSLGSKNGVIQKGWISAYQLRIIGYFSLGFGILFGIPSVLMAGSKMILSIGGFTVLGILTYSGRPFGLKYRALGEVLVLLLLGPFLCLGLCQSVFQQFDLGVLLLGLFFGSLACSVPHSSHLQDLEPRSPYKALTLASVLGFKLARHFFAVFYGFAFGTLGIATLLGYLPLRVLLLTCLGIPLIFLFFSILYKASGPVSALLSQLRSSAIKTYSFVGCLVFLSILISSVID